MRPFDARIRRSAPGVDEGNNEKSRNRGINLDPAGVDMYGPIGRPAFALLSTLIGVHECRVQRLYWPFPLPQQLNVSYWFCQV